MKNSKYLIFISIGFELVVLILVGVWLGNYLVKEGYSKSMPALCVLGALVIWFVSLMLKLKRLKND